MGKVRTMISLIFAPIIKGWKSFRKWWKRRSKAGKIFAVIAGILLFYATAQWIILALQVLMGLIFLNLGLLWIKALIMMTRSVLDLPQRRGKKKKPSSGKKPRGGKQGRRARKNKSTSRS